MKVLCKALNALRLDATITDVVGIYKGQLEESFAVTLLDVPTYKVNSLAEILNKHLDQECVLITDQIVEGRFESRRPSRFLTRGEQAT